MANKNIFRFHLLFLVSLQILSQFAFVHVVEATKLPANSSHVNEAGCLESERNALVRFKRGLEDPSGWLSFWVGKDCCKWHGVGCSEGHVVRLDLENFLLRGEIGDALLDLKYLVYLDLSFNNFEGSSIPTHIGLLRELRYLNLSYTSFRGMVPPHLGNLSNLHHLDLYSDPERDYSYGNLWAPDLSWITRLMHLKTLNLGYVDLSLASTTWLQSINMIPSLFELHLESCNLRNLSSTLPQVNLSSLRVLDLGINSFDTMLPYWISNISTLETLNLLDCQLKGQMDRIAWRNLHRLKSLLLFSNSMTGEIVEVVGGLVESCNKSLEVLMVSENRLKGHVPQSIGQFKCLRLLYLGSNFFSGPVPILQLPELKNLDLAWNNWEGIVTESHFTGLEKLVVFFISCSSNTLVIDLSDQWLPPFSLHVIAIDGCRLGPGFPAWLQTQKHLTSLTLQDAAITGEIPHWIWEMLPNLTWLILSGNHFAGELPTSIKVLLDWVDLSSNNLGGPLPVWPNLINLHLGNNSFSGPIPQDFCSGIPFLRYLDLSRNFLNGTIPSCISELQYLEVLDLSRNHFCGNLDIPWNKMSLDLLDLSNNKLSGEIPISLCSSPNLGGLNLFGNSLSGELCESLHSCKYLSTLNFGENRLSGRIPDWIGDSDISILNLEGNSFSGNIPEHLCLLPRLHIIDLSRNNFSGRIPPCFGNLSGLKSPEFYNQVSRDRYVLFYEKMQLVVKGRQLEYNSILDIMNLIDLSGNNLKGGIPKEITDLTYLGTLNLSYNQLSGKIPEKIANLRFLETLDLSCNHLSGPIPTSMSSMTLLNYLNLSYNNLSGPIPTGNQFQTFINASTYEGNPQLCGFPLPNNCSVSDDDRNPKEEDEDEDEDEDGMYHKWFYTAMAMGFVVGFCVVVGTLILKKSWRHAYFQFMVAVQDKLYVIVAVNVARVRRKLERST